MPKCVVQELVRAILANPNLKVFYLSSDDENLDWEPHMLTLLKCLKDHKGLVFKVTVGNSAFGPDFSYLQELLSQNRDITVTDEDWDNLFG